MLEIYCSIFAEKKRKLGFYIIIPISLRDTQFLPTELSTVSIYIWKFIDFLENHETLSCNIICTIFITISWQSIFDIFRIPTIKKWNNWRKYEILFILVRISFISIPNLTNKSKEENKAFEKFLISLCLHSTNLLKYIYCNINLKVREKFFKFWS